jgi:MFS family permease
MRPTPDESSSARTAPSINPVPSRARHVVVGFVLSLAIITYIDRVCISQTAPDIRHDLGLDEKQMGWVFFVFGMAYALFEIPAGWLGDRYGPRGVLMKVVVMWSVFTAATGAAWNYVSLLVCRILFGAGEAGCFPNATKIFSIWVPSTERIRAQSLLWLSARWGGAFTPAIVTAVLAYVNWRGAFGFFGAIGVVWAVAFYRWFRDRPREHPSVNAAELALLDGAERNAPCHAPVPWRTLLRSRTVWLLWLQYFCLSYGWYFYVTWLPTYLREARHVPLEKSAVLAGLPLFFGGFGCLAGGWAAKQLAIRWGDVGRARRTTATAGLFAAAAMIVLASKIDQPLWAMVALGCASFANDVTLAPSWVTCMDVGGRLSGSLSGSMNMMGNFGGALGPLVVGYILDRAKPSPTAPPSLEGWSTAFLVAAAVYVVAAISWFFIDPVTSLDVAPERIAE